MPLFGLRETAPGTVGQVVFLGDCVPSPIRDACAGTESEAVLPSGLHQTGAAPNHEGGRLRAVPLGSKVSEASWPQRDGGRFVLLDQRAVGQNKSGCGH